MKQIYKEYLIFVMAVIAIILILCAGLLPILHINNVLFALLYLVIPYPLILIGIYKIVVILYNKIAKL